MKTVHDWITICEEYVQGDDALTMDALAAKRGINPSLMRRHGSKENWVERRAQYRRLVATKTRDIASTAEAEIRARHIRTAKLMMSIGQTRLVQMARRLQENPAEIVQLSVFEARQLIAVGAEIERRAAGIPDASEVDFKALQKLSDEELVAIIEGKVAPAGPFGIVKKTG